MPKKCIGLSPNYRQLTLRHKHLPGPVSGSRATVILATSIVHNGRRFASPFGFGLMFGTAVNIKLAFADTTTVKLQLPRLKNHWHFPGKARAVQAALYTFCASLATPMTFLLNILHKTFGHQHENAHRSMLASQGFKAALANKKARPPGKRHASCSDKGRHPLLFPGPP